MTSLESIVCDLKELPAEKLDRAASFIHRLRSHGRNERLGVIRNTNGCLAGAAGASFADAIEAGCERIDPSGW